MYFNYQSEKFSTARHMLMLPHPKGEADSIKHALHECSLAFNTLNYDLLDDHSKKWVSIIEKYLDTSGFDDPDERGLFEVKNNRVKSTVNTFFM